jgi:hypothetical protein
MSGEDFPGRRVIASIPAHYGARRGLVALAPRGTDGVGPLVGVRVVAAAPISAVHGRPNEALQPTGAAILACRGHWLSVRPRRLNLAFGSFASGNPVSAVRSGFPR